jgi:hypothetical protein
LLFSVCFDLIAITKNTSMLIAKRERERIIMKAVISA